jgi:hypothetical protein
VATDDRSFRHALWLFPCVTTLHNLEEAIWLPAWSQQGTHLHAPVGALEFRFAVAALTAAAWVVTLLARRGGPWLAAASGYWAAMLANVLAPHVAASIVERGYTPGVVTAVALNLPVNIHLLRRARREGRLSRREIAIAAACVIPALLVAIPVLFAGGRWIAGGG